MHSVDCTKTLEKNTFKKQTQINCNEKEVAAVFEAHIFLRVASIT